MHEKCPECEEMQKSHRDYCVWCGFYREEPPQKYICGATNLPCIECTPCCGSRKENNNDKL